MSAASKTSSQTKSGGTPTVFSNSNFWLGTEESLENVYQLNKFLADPRPESEKGAMLAGYMVDQDDEEPRYDGIGAHIIQVEGNLGIIHVNGSMTNRYSYWNRYFGVVSYPELRDAAAMLASDPEIKDILVLIDTGGGSAHGCPDTADFIRSIDQGVKPVYFHSPNFCFSAGMWLASSGRRFTANKVAEQGSVGVVVTLVSYYKLYEDAGIEFKTIRAGKYKALGQPTEPLSDNVIAMVEEKADRLYNYFVEAVVSGRPKLSVATKESWAEGKTFFTEDAVALGITDEISSFDKEVDKFLTTYNNEVGQAYFSDADHSLNLSEEGTDMSKANNSAKRSVVSQAALAAASLGAQVPTDVVEDDTNLNAGDDNNPAPTDGAETKVDDGGTPEADLNNGQEVPSAPDGDSASLADKYIEQGLKLGQVTGELSQMTTKVESLSAEVVSLKAIAAQSVMNLQVSLNQVPMAKEDLLGMSTETLVNMNTRLRNTFEESYSIGSARSETMAESRDKAGNVDNTFCQIHKQSEK